MVVGPSSFVAAIVTHRLLHWQRIVGMVRRYVIMPLAPGRRLPQVALSPRQPQKEA